MKAQRLRVTFSRGEDLKYITHLDMMRFWERTLRRAGIPMAYSEGFSPHPQIALAAPLAVGVTSDAELLDVFLDTPMLPRDLVAQVTPQLPDGISISRVEEVGLGLPSMQAEVKAAEYLVAVGATEADASAAIDRFLKAESIPWEHKRDDETRSYDIRTLVYELEVVPPSPPRTGTVPPPVWADAGQIVLRMLLRNDNSGSGRPEQVAMALGLGQPASIHRRRIILSDASPARTAYRKRGRFAE